MAADFKPSKAGMKKLEKDLAKKLGSVSVPRGGSETAATRDVEDQLKKKGITPSDAEVQRMVREQRRNS
ncbi:hypothetical protein ACLTEW_26200 [Gordonia lacunae]|uniref:hypothetical protein n=1 Tax=Gordonia TaxID=2053 RepID=UPI00200A7CF8|nr:hypothetical protein [Gordonia terrae]UPW11948.1 hypothetical protein M1C59_25660 [Gordonia terrae]